MEGGGQGQLGGGLGATWGRAETWAAARTKRGAVSGVGAGRWLTGGRRASPDARGFVGDEEEQGAQTRRGDAAAV